MDGARLAQAVARVEVALGEEDEDERRLVHVTLEVANLLEVVHVEKDAHARQQPLQRALHHGHLVLATRPNVREEEMEEVVRAERELWRPLRQLLPQDERPAVEGRLVVDEHEQHDDHSAAHTKAKQGNLVDTSEAHDSLHELWFLKQAVELVEHLHVGAGEEVDDEQYLQADRGEGDLYRLVRPDEHLHRQEGEREEGADDDTQEGELLGDEEHEAQEEVLPEELAPFPPKSLALIVRVEEPRCGGERAQPV